MSHLLGIPNLLKGGHSLPPGQEGEQALKLPLPLFSTGRFLCSSLLQTTINVGIP